MMRFALCMHGEFGPSGSHVCLLVALLDRWYLTVSPPNRERVATDMLGQRHDRGVVEKPATVCCRNNSHLSIHSVSEHCCRSWR